MEETVQNNALHKGNPVYRVGESVEEDGLYVCVPCGQRQYLKVGSRFPSCLKCLNQEERKRVHRGLELWERLETR